MAQSNRGRSASQLSVLIQSGVLDPVTLTEETFAAIRASADQSIFVSLLEERALLEASASARRIQEGRSLGLLDGIPVAWKDLFDIEGIATTAGSAILKTAEPAVCDADVVKALAGAGM
ncbi:MAG TPA: amidase family protein, partial [Methylophilaceae bacterium]|nr:amidase family protein [Methylophilaceae bacterium]